MNITLGFVFFQILLLGTPVFAQNPCAECFEASQEQLKQCLGQAISQEDKKSCAERQQAKAKGCENAACVIERANIQNNKAVLPQKK